MTMKTADGKPCEGLDQGPFEPIAVIGLAALMPDAKSIDAFWQNIIDSKVSIREIQEGRWPGPVRPFLQRRRAWRTAKRDSHTPKSVHLFMVLNSIGADGGNLLAAFRK